MKKLGQRQSQTPISSAFWVLDQKLMSRHLPDTPKDTLWTTLRHPLDPHRKATRVQVYRAILSGRG